MNGLKNIANELGKTFLNIAVAIFIFVFLQPFVKGELNISLIIYTLIGFIIFVVLGSLLLYFGGNKDDT